MRKNCAVCKKVIDLTDEGAVIKSVGFPSMNYCMCEYCGSVNVECSSNAALIALDQVISEPIQKDAEASVTEYLVKNMGFDDFIDALIVATEEGLQDFKKEVKKELKEEKENKKQEEKASTSKIKIAKMPSLEKVTKISEDKAPEEKINIKVDNKDKTDIDQRDIAYVVYNRGKIVKEYSKNIDVATIFNELIEIYGIAAIATERVTLHEINQIKPKIKERVVYELDM